MIDRRPRSQARYLVAVMDRGDNESVVLELARLTAERAGGGRQSHLIVCELVEALATMLRRAAGPPWPQDPNFGLELTNDDDEQQISIDETSPQVRASVRALLAQLNDHTEDALFQVDLALREPSFQATLDVFTHVLLWTIGALKWCDANEVSRPQWLGELASSPTGPRGRRGHR
jgi:hypothetical protein